MQLEVPASAPKAAPRFNFLKCHLADTSIADSSDSLEPIVICCFGLWELSHEIG